jgi:hypothetical protein
METRNHIKNGANPKSHTSRNFKLNKMKKTLIAFIFGFSISGLVAFTVANYEAKKNTAEVDQIQGFYIFAKGKPVKEYEYLGTVKGPLIGNHEFDNLVELMVKNAKKDFPNANALIFDGAIKQTHNTKVSAVKIKD